MAEAQKIDIEIAAKQTGDGLAKAEKGVRDLEKSSKGLSATAVKGWNAWAAASGKLRAAINGVKAAMGPVMLAVGAVAAIVAKWREWAENARAAAEETRRLAAEKAAAERAGELEKVVKAYADIAANAKAAADETARHDELEDIALANARKLRDARLDLAEQKELEGATTDAERREITARYAEKRQRYASGDSVSDAKDRSGREWKAGEEKMSQAAAIEESVKSGAAEIAARRAAAREELEKWWAEMNRETVHLEGTPEEYRDRRVPTREEAKEYEERNAALEAEATAAEEKFAAMAAQAAALRAQAEQLLARSKASLDKAAAYETAGEARNLAAARNRRDADAGLAAEREAIRKAERDSRRFPMEMAFTRMQIADEDARLEKAAGRRDSESRDAFEAKNRLDAAAANRGRGSRSESDYKAALAAYEKELAEEREAIRAFERVSREHAHNMGVFAAHLKEQEKRLDAANALLSRTQGYTGNE